MATAQAPTGPQVTGPHGSNNSARHNGRPLASRRGASSAELGRPRRQKCRRIQKFTFTPVELVFALICVCACLFVSGNQLQLSRRRRCSCALSNRMSRTREQPPAGPPAPVRRPRATLQAQINCELASGPAPSGRPAINSIDLRLSRFVSFCRPLVWPLCGFSAGEAQLAYTEWRRFIPARQIASGASGNTLSLARLSSSLSPGRRPRWRRFRLRPLRVTCN